MNKGNKNNRKQINTCTVKGFGTLKPGHPGKPYAASLSQWSYNEYACHLQYMVSNES